jgi:hypothetical protein
MANRSPELRDVSHSLLKRLKSLPAKAYMGACWVLCSEIERLAADHVPEDGRRLMRSTLEELGSAIDAADSIPSPPRDMRLVDEWNQLSSGQIDHQATAHIYFAFEDIANMLADINQVGRAHSWLLNPFIDLLQGLPADEGKGYVRVDNISISEDAVLMRYLEQVDKLLSELEAHADHSDVRALALLRGRVFEA